ncbi:putative dehydrogenase [Saccharomonospora amisosensis]|uniref:Putative dehydrogenase n=1 Tax=Saccharomonospora amisosensis TaxID=1128677 RepID=A0A7X5ZNW8_9PSEU|nr:Gfo/Idh/MocA family oxidoreductase [Saccharomonospora amisosensis]NIJ10163.1 putative dehydrogenase [Saccharomonospora amisosensis]
MSRLRIAVVGAGLIGRRHVELVRGNPRCELVSVVDPDPAARDAGSGSGHALLPDLLAETRVDGVIVASPNRHHVEHALCCVDAGVPVLVEKPLADSVADAERLVCAAEAGAVPLAVGHHRRHSPLVAVAAEIVRGGVLGRLVAVQGSAVFRKPDDYFEQAPWRREPGGGPILINLSHEIDNLRAICGEIVTVQAAASNRTRGFPVEDTVAITLRFAGDALGSFLLSDAAASARSWEQTSREDPRYPHHPDEDCYLLAGTNGSLSVPTMRLRVFDGTPSWWQPFVTSKVEVPMADPLERQLEQFCAVLRGEQPPLASGREGLRTLRVTQAVAEAARTGAPVTID